MKTERSFLVAFLLLATAISARATPYDVSVPVTAVPPNIVSTPNKPMLMLATSKDHTLWGPAYTDFEDLEGDGAIETTFKPTFKYYGYFDATKCYVYDGAGGGLFKPSGNATLTSDKRYTCSPGGALWSGNFLNWATMTRLDVVRKMLYGGKRSTDTATVSTPQSGPVSVANSNTVLERANVSQDSHAFVKFYYGADISDYTPFSTADLTKSTGKNAGKYAGLTICNISNGNVDGGSVPLMRMAKGNYRLWSTVNGLVCQWGNSFTEKSARYFQDVDKGNGVIAHETAAVNLNTDGARYGANGPDLTVRVRVCDPTKLGEERCQAFPPDSTTNFKPYGIFQEFGLKADNNSSAKAEFGVLTGSYDRNLTAGALRKNMGDFADEINAQTGVFCHIAGSGCAASIDGGARLTGQGAIQAMDSFVLYRYNGDYEKSTGRKDKLPRNMTNGGDLAAWGNPIGEMVVQALQYYAGVSQTNPTTTTIDQALGIKQQQWTDPLSRSNQTRVRQFGNSICRPMYTMALSSSALSFDGLDGDPGSDSEIQNLFSGLPNRAMTLNAYTDGVGDAEGITNTVRSVGSVDGGWGETCASKRVSKLSLANGVCPEAPGVGGSYKVAGAAWYANTSKIRTLTQAQAPRDINKVQDALKVKTLAASLSGGAARIEVPIPGTNPTKYVFITPEGLWNAGGKKMPAALLTFNSISAGTNAQGLPYAAFVATWNDTLFGGDYDMDIVGFLRYDIVADPTSPTGYGIKIMTDITDTGAGYTGLHGYSLMGTNKDQRWLTHSHNTAGDPLKGSEGYLCGNQVPGYLDYTTKHPVACSIGQNAGTGSDPVTLQFQMKGVDNVILRDPLWYAAKYGYFPSSKAAADGSYTDISLPEGNSWDQVRSDGTTGQDGVPDGYFLARRPDVLEQQLRRALMALVEDSNSAPATTSVNLLAEGFKYTAQFDSNTVSGSLAAYSINDAGDFLTTPTWEAGRLLQASAGATKGGNRSIVTNTAAGGVPFRWGSLDANYKKQITTDSTNKLTAENAERVVNYVRGDQSLEGPSGLRQREGTLLGPVVNGTPWMQGRPNARFTGATAAGYSDFYRDHFDRDSLLWVPANDGMLHAFNPKTGQERFAFVPGMLANRLAEIPLQRKTGAATSVDGAPFVINGVESRPDGVVWPYVDGNPFAADVKVGEGESAAWKSYVFSTLGRGGKGLFALDATDASRLTETNASSIFKWQFTSDDDADLGYIVGDIDVHPTSNQAAPVAKMNNGKFALILGNGYRSRDGKAALFIFYMDGPNGQSWSGRYKKIVVEGGPDNGLSMPRWEDYDGNGTADVVYAGDLKGNLWKFDLSSANPSEWDVAYKVDGASKPLYTATYTTASGSVLRLPITTAPLVLFRGQGGMMVNFGTGNAFGAVDFPDNSKPQRFYGIWDRPLMNTTRGRPLPTGVGTLAQRSATRDATTGVVTITGAAIDYRTKDGWYFDFPNSSEMVLSNPDVSAGMVSAVTVRPKPDNANYCSTTPDAALYTFDPFSGKPERNAQGLVAGMAGAPSTLIAAKDIMDQKVKVVNDRTKKPFETSCRSGEPGCECVGNKCQRAAVCGPGQAAKRVTGRRADALICYSTAPRIQWREIPGVRTTQ